MVHLTEKAKKSTPSIYRFIAEMYTQMSEQGYDLVKFTLGDPTTDVYEALSDVGIFHYLEGRGVGDGIITSEQIKKIALILDFDEEKLKGKARNYTSFQGDRDQRDKLAKAFNKRHDTNYTGDNFISTVGANGAMNLVIDVLKGPFIIHEPGFGVYHKILDSKGKYTIAFDTTDNNFAVEGREGGKLDRVIEEAYKKELKKNKELKREDFNFTFLFTDPGNPTGYKHSKEELEAIRGLFLTKWKGANIIADSLYFELAHDEENTITLLDVSKGTDLEENIVFVDSISKADSASSDRGGYAVCNDPELARAAANEQLGDAVHPAYVSQKIVAAAIEMREEYVRKNAEMYGKKSQFVSETLVQEGMMNYSPNAIFYSIMDLSLMKDVPLSENTKARAREFYGDKAENIISSDRVGNNSFLASVELAQRTGVFSVPLLPVNETEKLQLFSEDRGKEPKPLVRIVPTLEMEKLKEAVNRLVEFKKEVELGKNLPSEPPKNSPLTIQQQKGEVGKGVRKYFAPNINYPG